MHVWLEALPRFACQLIRSWLGSHLVLGVEWACCVRTWSSTHSKSVGLSAWPLLGSCIDLTRDRDDGVLLDPIFFGSFSRSYAPLFNKTSRMRCLDGFDSINSRNYIWKPFSGPYIYILCVSWLFDISWHVYLSCLCAWPLYVSSLLAGHVGWWPRSLRHQCCM